MQQLKKKVPDHTPMPLWKWWLLLALSVATVLTVTAEVSRAPTIPDITGPKPPALIRRGGGEPELSAEAVLIQRLKTGEVLFSKDPETRLPIASLTKLMTALVFVDAVEPLEVITFSPGAKTAGGPEEKRSGLKAGDRLRAEDVLKLIIISSDADAAYAAAEHVAFGLERDAAARPFNERIGLFVREMNRRAETIGLKSTHFANPSGGDHPENFSSAKDLTALAAIIERDAPEIWALSRIRETFVFGLDGQRYGAVNTNQLLDEFPSMYGSKTGFEEAAKGALLVLYQLAPQDPTAIVLLRSRDRLGDGRAAIRWLEESFVLE